MEERRVEGRNLVENIVYNIYKNEGNVNIGVCLVIAVNNGNNRTKIKLRKLIGRNELSLTKSEIYGKNPVNLSDAILTGANLTGANLTGADLTDSNLTGADLIGAFLTDADLTDADLTDAILTGAYLTIANLTSADLTDAILTYANLTDAILTGAILTGANLTSADLTDATIFQDSLSPLQKQQIIGQPNYIERERRITIPENLLNPKHSNNSCPNFNELYEFIIRQNLSGMFFFIYEGSNSNVIDFGGPKRDVFDKMLPVYTNKFFEEIEDNEDYVILMEGVDMNTLIRETEQLILLAKASETKIFLKIDPILLSLLVEGQQFFIEYFTNNQRNRFSKLYRVFNEYIEHSNNNSQLLKYNTNNRELIQKFKSQELKNEELKKTLEQEIRFRRFAITCGFANMKQFIHMANFIKLFYNISPEDRFIDFVLKFDIETIVKRIKLCKKTYVNQIDYNLEPIPLEQYVRLSQNNESILILNRANDIIMTYPYLIPFLNFIFGPESSDDDRKLFVVYVSGSSSYTGELKIYLSSLTRVKAGQPFHSTTCGKYLELFKNKKQNRHSITVDTIRIQLLSDTGFGRA